MHNFGAGDILEIKPETGTTVMIPFSEAAIPEIDVDEGFLLVEPYAAGLAASDDAEEDDADRHDAEPGAGDAGGDGGGD